MLTAATAASARSTARGVDVDEGDENCDGVTVAVAVMDVFAAALSALSGFVKTADPVPSICMSDTVHIAMPKCAMSATGMYSMKLATRPVPANGGRRWSRTTKNLSAKKAAPSASVAAKPISGIELQKMTVT